MENLGDKILGANKKLEEIKGILEEYPSVDHRTKRNLNVLKGISIKIVGALTEVMKVYDYKLIKRTCEIVDGIIIVNNIIWSFSWQKKKDGEVALKKLIPQINEIFMTNDG